jgi:hypothetical protein
MAESNSGKVALGSEKRDNFRRIAEGRMNSAIDAVLRIGKLSNRQLYDWDESDVKKMMKALRDTVSEIEARFESPKAKAAARFKF